MIISWESPGGGFVDELNGCGPFRDLEELLGAERLGAVEKNLSDVSTMGENLILLVALHSSFSFSSSSEL